jgi:hypothetical protein
VQVLLDGLAHPGRLESGLQPLPPETASLYSPPQLGEQALQLVLAGRHQGLRRGRVVEEVKFREQRGVPAVEGVGKVLI